MTADGSFDPRQHFQNLKGQSYLQVRDRVTWFRDEHADGYILTELVEHDAAAGMAMFKARAGWFTAEDREAFATGYGSETKGDFADYVEKAETKAIGRALACLGYGTAQAMDLDEGGSVADSPVERRARPAQQQPARAQTLPARRPAPLEHVPQSIDPLAAKRARLDTLLRAYPDAMQATGGRGALAIKDADLDRAIAKLNARATGEAVDPKAPHLFAQTMQQALDDADENERELSADELADLLGLIKTYLHDDVAQQGIYAAQGISVDAMTGGEAKSAFRWLKERAERRAQKEAV